MQTIGGLVLAAAVVLGLSYCSERPKRQFAGPVIEGAKQIPGARLISSFKSGDLTSPVSWFWPATSRLVYARPDITAPTPRFYVMSFGYKETPFVYLVEPNCQARTEVTYFQPDPGDNGDPARNIMGDPVIAPNGKPFLRHDTHIPPSAEELHALCDTDWTPERKAVAATTSQ